MNSSGQPLRCLLVEDMEDDARLVLRALRTGGYDVTSERVETADAMRAALLGKSWDVILSDYQMPNFSGLRALELLHTTGLDLPFIIVSGTIGESVAVGCMKAGAHDYLMKDALARLVPAIQRELREAADRGQRRAAEEALRSNERRFRSFFELSNVGMSLTQVAGDVQVNRAMCEMLGYSLAEFSHLTWQAVTHPDDIAATQLEIDAMLSGRKASTRLIKRYLQKNGSVVWGDLSSTLHRAEAGQPAYMITAVVDITERKRSEAVDAFLAQSGSRPGGESFFAALARFLATNLQMDYICIDRLDGDALNATTVAVWHDGDFEDNVTYRLKDTPCSEVVEKKVCCYPAHVRESFPNDEALQQLQAESYVGITLFSHSGQPIGLIAVIGRRVLTNRALAEATLAQVAPRAAGELERLAAEAQLQQSAERYRMITDNASDLIWLYDLATKKFDYISPSVERLLGYTRAELRAVDLTDVLTPASAAEARATLGRRLAALARGDLSHLRHLGRYEHVRKDGSIMIGEVTSTALLDPAGQPLKILGVARDITEREQNRAALEESESRFRTIFERAGVGVALVGLDGRWMDVNDRLAEILGYPREELLQQTFQNVTCVEDLGADLALVERTIAGEIPGYTLEKRYVRKDGALVWTQLTVAIVRSTDGQPMHFISVVEDLTDRKQAAEAVQASERTQRKLAETLAQAQTVGGVGSWETDLATQQVNWSEQTHRIFETTAATFQPSHQAFLAFVHPADCAAVDAAFIASAKVCTPCAIEHRIVMPDGRIKHLEERWEIFRDENNCPVRAVGTCLVITERKQAELALRQQSDELRTRNATLARFNTVAVGRELRMIELKREVNDLCAKLGEPPRFRVPAVATLAATETELTV